MMPDPAETSKKRRFRLWKKTGGKALSISLLVHLLLLMLGIFWVWRIIPENPPKQPDFVSSDGGGGGGSGSEVRVLPSFRKQPPALAATSSQRRLLAADTLSDFTLPQADSDGFSEPLPLSGAPVLADSATGGSGQGSGSGTGIGNGQGPGFGNGRNGGAGNHLSTLPPVRFFGQPTKAKRVAYVIDFSKSMNGRRQRLMRDELVKSINGLDLTQQYELIFFAGPVWVAGSKVTLAPDQKSGTVTTPEGREHHWTSRSVGEWQMSGRKQETSWLQTDQENLQRSISSIRETPLVYGTDWKPALELALAMNPAPEVIYFMTDGIVSEKVYDAIDDLARTARHHKSVIHTIAMMEPEAADAMRTLATKTGGSFTMIHPDGTTTNESQSP